MLRFKTKQEFKGSTKNWNYEGEMDILYGLPYERGVPVREQYNPDIMRNAWHIKEYHLIDAPHPYEGKKVCVRVDSAISPRVQLKAFELGYGWGVGREKTVKYTNYDYLYFDHPNMRITHGELKPPSSQILLTYEQFWNGDQVPVSAGSDCVDQSRSDAIRGQAVELRDLGAPSYPWKDLYTPQPIIMDTADAIAALSEAMKNLPTAPDFRKGGLIKGEPNIHKQTNIKKDGKIIKVQRTTPAVRHGKSPRGCTISGRTIEASTRRGRISYQAVSSRG